MNISEQEKTFAGFMKATKYGIIGVIGILVLLASIA